MPLYEYRCGGCATEFEMRHGYNDTCDACPACDAKGPERLISATYGVVRQDPKTIKHLADRNTQKMGRYEYEARCKEETERKERAKQGLQKELPKGMTRMADDPEFKAAPDPWWRGKGEAVDKSLAELTPKEQMNYIWNGDKNKSGEAPIKL